MPFRPGRSSDGRAGTPHRRALVRARGGRQ
jgi:hypothetical protein